MCASLALAVGGLCRSYRGFEALREFDLRMGAGECVAVIGRNGSGKTTAVRVISGLLEPSAGVVQVVGASMHHEPESIAARAALSLVPDTPLLYADLTVAEHLELVALAHGAAGDDLDDRIRQILSRLALWDRRDSQPGTLSRGMRQKVQLACALTRPYRVLVLDEPIVGLDPASQATLGELLVEAKQQGVAVLFTTHQLDWARGIADRVIVLEEGAVVEAGPYDEVIDGERIRGGTML